MNINLPQPIAAYFAADKLDGEAVARCFVNGAIVKDEGHTYMLLTTSGPWSPFSEQARLTPSKCNAPRGSSACPL